MQPESTMPGEPAEGPPRGGSPTYFERLKSVTDRLAGRLDPNRSVHEGGFGPGDVAELRRMDVARGIDEACPAFWRVVVEDLESDEFALVEPYAEAAQLTPWLAILQTWAQLAGFHRASRSLGEALHEAGVSEMRLTRLLRARGDELFDHLRKVAHQVHSAGEPLDFVEVARLVLSAGSPHGETVRRRIASSYYRAESHSRNSGQNTD